ncbi:MAG: SGNH/GDSL hydrolase family protein [Candidatus Omnitrophota bacterium]
MKKIIKLLLFCCYTFLITVILLELFARFIIKQPYYAFPEGYFVEKESYGYGLAQNFKGIYSQPEFTISINTNSDGLRDKEHLPCDNCYKILALGDSFTFGDGVELNDTYLSILEDTLNKNANKKHEIIKAGVVGYSTYNERLYLEKKGLGYHPHLVFVQFWWDDLGIDKISYLAEAGFLTTGKIKSFARWRLFLNKNFRAYAFLRALYTKIFNKALFASKANFFPDSEDGLRQKLNITLRQFRNIEEFCKQNNTACLFLLIPLKEFVYDKGGFKKQWDVFRNFLDKNDIRYIDVTPQLTKAVNKGETVFFTVDPHLNKNGHRIVAEALYQYLSRN